MRENLLPVRIIRRQKATTSEDIVQTTRFAVLWGVHLDRISREHIIAINYLALFSTNSSRTVVCVSGARAFCFGERYRDILYQNLDENNNSTDCCTVVVLRT